MKYKIRDLQFDNRFFGGYEGITFTTKQDILGQLVYYHNNDYTGVRKDNSEYDNIEQMFSENNITGLEDKLDWVLDYGRWRIEKTK